MQAKPEIPKSVISFVSAYVDHVVKLQFLLFLHAAPSGATSMKIVSRALDVPKYQIIDMANELAADHLVRLSRGAVELAPQTIDVRLALADLADWYARDRRIVLDLLRAMGRLAS